MHEFIPGQRWISDAELQMGLCTILSTDHRTVTVLFPASDEQRVYAKQSAPLTRVHFTEGDLAQSQEGWSLTVETNEPIWPATVARLKQVMPMITYIHIEKPMRIMQPATRQSRGQQERTRVSQPRTNQRTQQNRQRRR